MKYVFFVLCLMVCFGVVQVGVWIGIVPESQRLQFLTATVASLALMRAIVAEEKADGLIKRVETALERALGLSPRGGKQG